jgi:hypothetical protein
MKQLAIIGCPPRELVGRSSDQRPDVHTHEITLSAERDGMRLREVHGAIAEYVYEEPSTRPYALVRDHAEDLMA